MQRHVSDLHQLERLVQPQSANPQTEGDWFETKMKESTANAFGASRDEADAVDVRCILLAQFGLDFAKNGIDGSAEGFDARLVGVERHACR
jgi:hypothetical protein